MSLTYLIYKNLENGEYIYIKIGSVILRIVSFEHRKYKFFKSQIE